MIFFKNLSRAPSASEEKYYFQTLTQNLCLLYLGIHSAFGVIYYALDLSALATFNIISVGVYLSALHLLERGKLGFAWFIINIEAIAYASLCFYLIGNFGSRDMLIFLPILYFLYAAPFYRRLAYLGFISFVYAGLSWYQVIYPPKIALNPDVYTSMDIGINAMVLFILAYLVFFTYRAAIKNEKQLKAIHQKLQQDYYIVEKLAVTDFLTKLHNRDKMDQTIAYEMERADRYNTQFSIILIDIDHFKTINDNYGHAAGDKILMRFAEILKNSVRKIDVVGRWGGEEFMIVCPETDGQGAMQAAEKLRAAIERDAFNGIGPVTASFGICFYQTNLSKQNLIENADKALYQAKKAGRNQLILAA